MAVLFQRNNAVFQPGTDNFPVSIAGDITQIQVALEHRDWPEGDCFAVDVTWSNGSNTGTFTCGGGVIRDKAGNPTGGTSVTTWTCNKPAGVTAGVVNFVAMQRISTALLIEGF